MGRQASHTDTAIQRSLLLSVDGMGSTSGRGLHQALNSAATASIASMTSDISCKDTCSVSPATQAQWTTNRLKPTANIHCSGKQRDGLESKKRTTKAPGRIHTQ